MPRKRTVATLEPATGEQIAERIVARKITRDEELARDMAAFLTALETGKRTHIAEGRFDVIRLATGRYVHACACQSLPPGAVRKCFSRLTRDGIWHDEYISIALRRSPQTAQYQEDSDADSEAVAALADAIKEEEDTL